MSIGNIVFMKREGIIKKKDSQFYVTLFKNTKIKFTKVNLKYKNAKIHTRHITFFKEVNGNRSQTISWSVSEKEEPEQNKNRGK